MDKCTKEDTPKQGSWPPSRYLIYFFLNWFDLWFKYNVMACVFQVMDVTEDEEEEIKLEINVLKKYSHHR